MPRWYYDKKELRQTPSILAGLDPDVEARYRREGARFIIDLGATLNLSPTTTLATGVMYFHRFYMFHTFQNFPRYPTACACLFLAGKVEETPKKCKDVIKFAQALLPEKKFAQFGDDVRNHFEEIMTLERILLQTIKFDLQVEHPYTFLLKYAKCLKGNKTKLQKMVQMAWTFVNDSLCTTLCLQWEPEIIAIALMYLAGKLSKFEVEDWNGRAVDHLRWWDVFVEDISIELLEDICHQVLDLYSTNDHVSPEDSPPPQTSYGYPEMHFAADPSSPGAVVVLTDVDISAVNSKQSTPVALSPVPSTAFAQERITYTFTEPSHSAFVQVPIQDSLSTSSSLPLPLPLTTPTTDVSNTPPSSLTTISDPEPPPPLL